MATKEKIKRKGYNKTTGHKSLKGISKTKERDGNWMTKKEAAERRASNFAMKEKNFKLAGKPKPKFSKTFKKSAKKQATKTLAKGIAKTALKAVGPIGVVLTAAEIARGAVKVGKSMKAKSDCKDKGGIYKKGFCITSKSIKAKMEKKFKKGSSVKDTISKR